MVFDLYGTIMKVDSNKDGLNTDKNKAVQSLWRSKQLEYSRLSALMERKVSFSQITSDALDYACEVYNLNDDEIKKQLFKIFTDAIPFEDTLEFIKNYSNENVLSILSNGDLSSIHKLLENNNLSDYFHDVFSAEMVNSFKPDQRIYNLVCKHYDCKASDVYFFSSNAWDISGASKFGFKTVWINRTKTVFEKLGEKPWKEVQSFNELEI